MNYFELHVGDYDAATAHLSMLEDAAYGRMIRIYYRTEKPLPADIKAVCRLARAVSKPERDAVQAVLDEFFTLTDDGWRQARCDEEIERFVASEPERAARRSNEETRLKRHREERAELFRALNDAGQHAPWNTKIEALRVMVTALQAPSSNGQATQPATAPETETASPATRPETAPATPATATHGNVSPPPTSHPPLPKEEEIPPPSGAPPAAAGRTTRGSRLPRDWSPDPEALAFAVGLLNGRCQSELDKFRDYWAALPGQKGVKTDWPATWRNWVRKAAEMALQRGSGRQSDPFETAR